MNNDLTVSAWLMKGITQSLPGTLEFYRDRIRFTVEDLQVFDAALTNIQNISFPFYYFGGGMKITVGGEQYRISFVEPGEDGNVFEGRRVGKIVRSILEPTGQR